MPKPKQAPGMPLFIRNVPPELLLAFRVQAMTDGRTPRQIILEMLTLYVETKSVTSAVNKVKTQRSKQS